MKTIIDPDNIASTKILIKRGFISRKNLLINNLPGENAKEKTIRALIFGV